MIDEYQYSIQSPFISLIKIERDIRENIKKEAWKVWEFLKQKTGFIYYPVLTIFTREYTVRYMKMLVEEYELGLQTNEVNPDYSPCLKSIYSALKEVNFGREYEIPPQSCFEWRKYLILFLMWLEEQEEKNSEIYYDFAERFFEKVKDFCWLANTSNRNIKTFIELLLQSICKYKRVWKLGGAQRGHPLTQIYDDIHSKYGCYTSPGFWAWLEKDRSKYDIVLKELGISGNINLFNLPCVFIYPFLTKSYSQELSIQTSISNEILLKELFTLLLVHEHGHALLRHGIYKSGDNIQWCSPSQQEFFDKKRQDVPWIEEGLTTYFEFNYLESYTKNENFPLYQILYKEIKDYVLSVKDLDLWAYYGMDIVGYYIHTGKKQLRSFISDWKKSPEVKIIEPLEKFSHFGKSLFDII